MPDARRVAFAHLSRAVLDAELSPSRVAKDPWGTLARHAAETASLDGNPALRRHPDVAYGPAARQRLDITGPLGTGLRPGLAFIHGGFWQEGGKGGSGFAARAWVARGWVHVGIGYTLAPQARLRGIVAEIAAALGFLRAEGPRFGLDPARLVLAGHSAGGHLAAAMLAGMGGFDPPGLAGVVPVSGVFDLAPVAASYVNDVAAMDAAEVAALSPLYTDPAADVPFHLVIGADEPPAFHAQTAALAAAWGQRLSRLGTTVAPGRDHFDVLDELADPASPTFAAIAAMGEMP
jgi:arylformamidase